MRRWKKILVDAELEAGALRCSKEKSILTYLGSFAEMPVLYRCVKDENHTGDCVFHEEALPADER